MYNITLKCINKKQSHTPIILKTSMAERQTHTYTSQYLPLYHVRVGVFLKALCL